MQKVTLKANQAMTKAGAALPAGEYYLSRTKPILQGGVYSTMNGRHLGWIFPPDLWLKRSLHPDLPLPPLAEPAPANPSHLRPWQRLALALSKKRPDLRAALIFPMGAGKTLTALSIAEGRDTLVLAPKYLHGQWQDEAKKFGLPCPPIHTFESASKLQPTDLLILDEALRVKNPSAQRSQAVTALSRQCKSVIGMTGTPISAKSGVDALWINAVWPGFLPPEVPLTFQFAHGTKWKDNDLGFRELVHDGWNWEKLCKFLEPVTLVVSQEEVYAHLPPLEVTRVTLPTPPEYSIAIAGGYTQEGKSKSIAQARQATSGFIYTDAGAVQAFNYKPKISWILEWLSDNPTLPVVIVSAYRHSQEALLEALADAGHDPAQVLFSSKSPEDEIRRFQNGQTRVLVMSPANSLGMNLQNASHLIFESCSTSPVNRQQAIGRVYRPGQEKPVTVYDLVASPLDEKLFTALDKHRDESSDFIEKLLESSDIKGKE